MSNLNILKFEDQKVILQTIYGESHYLPNLTTLVTIYHQHQNDIIGERIKEMLAHDIGTLLVIEIMIDATHPVTMSRLESGEISKNIKHVNDYYVILTSNIECAKANYKALASQGLLTGKFEDCCFNEMPFGMVIVREKFPQFTNEHYDQSAFENLF